MLVALGMLVKQMARLLLVDRFGAAVAPAIGGPDQETSLLTFLKVSLTSCKSTLASIMLSFSRVMDRPKHGGIFGMGMATNLLSFRRA
jgi:hypothetical protein